MGPALNNAHAILSSLRSVGNSLVSGVNALALRDNFSEEKIEFVKFAHLEYDPQRGDLGVVAPKCNPFPRRVLLLGYASGFQVWDVEHIGEHGLQPVVIASRRDEAVRYLDTVPQPREGDSPNSPLFHERPCLAVIPAEVSASSVPNNQQDVNGLVQFYSFPSNTIVHTLTFQSRVLSLRTSKRIIVVAVDAQIFGYDAVTLQCTMSSLTYPAPCTKHLMQGEVCFEGTAVPLAVGSRWLAFASNTVHTASGCAVPQRIAAPPSGEASLSSSLEAVSQLAKSAAKHSGKHLRVLGEAGMKYISGHYEQWCGNCHDANGAGPATHTDRPDHQAAADAAVVGTVQVRDVVSRTTVAHFRAHDSPLLLLEFDPSGILLVTASVHGHSVNIFQLAPVPNQHGNSKPRTGSAIHLYKLSRGLTPATIQDISFSSSGDLLCVSSARGTSHLFRLSQPGDAGGPAHLRAVSNYAKHGSNQRVVKLGSSGRVRNANSLNVNLPGSLATAAANLYGGASVIGSRSVSSAFLPRMDDGKGQRVYPRSECSHLLEEELFIAYDDSRLLRYNLRFVQPHADGEDNCSGSSYSSTPESSVSVIEDNCGEIKVEAVNAWQLLRGQEDEEGSWENCFKEGLQTELSREEEQRLWMANAETSLHVPHRQPLWNDGQFTLLEMQPTISSPSTPSALGPDASGMATSSGPKPLASPILEVSNIEVENVPTKHVNIPRGALSPVITGGAGSAVMRRPGLSPTVLHFDMDPHGELCDPVSPVTWNGVLQPDGY